MINANQGKVGKVFGADGKTVIRTITATIKPECEVLASVPQVAVAKPAEAVE